MKSATRESAGMKASATNNKKKHGFEDLACGKQAAATEARRGAPLS
jgi:hypothetical protein